MLCFLNDEWICWKLRRFDLFENTFNFVDNVVDNFILIANFHLLIEYFQFFLEYWLIFFKISIFIFFLHDIQLISSFFFLLELHLQFACENCVFSTIVVKNLEKLIVFGTNRKQLLYNHFRS